jgi:hypothetical protein
MGALPSKSTTCNSPPCSQPHLSSPSTKHRGLIADSGLVNLDLRTHPLCHYLRSCIRRHLSALSDVKILQLRTACSSQTHASRWSGNLSSGVALITDVRLRFKPEYLISPLPQTRLCPLTADSAALVRREFGPCQTAVRHSSAWFRQTATCLTDSRSNRES